MKSLLKILFFVFAMFIITVGETKSFTVVNLSQEEIPVLLFQKAEVNSFGFENDFENSCLNGEKIVICGEQGISIDTQAAKTET